MVTKSSLVRSLVRDSKMSLAQACKAAGVHYSHGMSAMKREGHKAPKSAVVRLARAKGVPKAFIAKALDLTYSHVDQACDLVSYDPSRV